MSEQIALIGGVERPISLEEIVNLANSATIICRIWPAGYRTRNGFQEKVFRLERIYDQTAAQEIQPREDASIAPEVDKGNESGPRISGKSEDSGRERAHRPAQKGARP